MLAAVQISAFGLSEFISIQATAAFLGRECSSSPIEIFSVIINGGI
jgi:hypothetical protein